jgi:osmotically-inducible protein OsmY
MQSGLIPHSDRDLERRVKGLLARQHLASLRAIQVDSQMGVVTISGRVSSFYERQLCITCCQKLTEVVKLNDQVEVARERQLSRPPLALTPFCRPALVG